MTPLHTAARMALDALEKIYDAAPIDQTRYDLCKALRSALAAPMPEPVTVLPDSPAAVEYIAERLAFNSGVRWRDLSNSERNTWRDMARKERNERLARAAPPAAPADMVMVPREPTLEMIEAADQSDKDYSLRAFGPGTVLAQSGYDHWVAMIAAAPPAAPAPAVPRHVRKIGGSFQHTGTVVAEFKTLAGEPRIVLEFDAPVAGMLHVYRPDQVEPCEQAHGIGGGK